MTTTCIASAVRGVSSCRLDRSGPPPLRATMAATSTAPGIDDLAYALPPDVFLLGQRGRQTDVRRGTDLVCHALDKLIERL